MDLSRIEQRRGPSGRRRLRREDSGECKNESGAEQDWARG